MRSRNNMKMLIRRIWIDRYLFRIGCMMNHICCTGYVHFKAHHGGVTSAQIGPSVILNRNCNIHFTGCLHLKLEQRSICSPGIADLGSCDNR